jgi:hypothetical protein
MDDLHKALGDISSIRRQVAHTTEFRGFGPATLAGTSLIALMASAIQYRFVSDPSTQIALYLSIWTGSAVLSCAITGVQVYTRSRRIHSGLSDEMIRMAVEQFLPSVGAGFLIMIVLLRCAPAALWILPGIWQVVFSLGVFASCRFLPRPIVAVGLWYMLTGLLCLALGDARALSPWTMGLSYGVGQLMAAAIVYFSAAEASHEG